MTPVPSDIFEKWSTFETHVKQATEAYRWYAQSKTSTSQSVKDEESSERDIDASCDETIEQLDKMSELNVLDRRVQKYRWFTWLIAHWFGHRPSTRTPTILHA